MGEGGGQEDGAVRRICEAVGSAGMKKHRHREAPQEELWGDAVGQKLL